MKRMPFSVVLFLVLAPMRVSSQVAIGTEAWVMPQEAALTYQRNVVQPLLDQAISDPTLPAGIKRRVQTLFFREIMGQRILYEAKPFYHPETRDMLAHVDFSIPADKPILMVFIPAIRDMEREYQIRRLPESALQIVLAIAFAHEMAHVELMAKYPIRERVRLPNAVITQLEESEAWAITILEMIRPALAQDRWLPDNYRQNSEEFRKAGDNYARPEWLRNFSGHPSYR